MTGQGWALVVAVLTAAGFGLRAVRLAAEARRSELYATHLALHLAARIGAPENWRPLRGDVVGLLTQIDNMCAGMAPLEGVHEGKLRDDPIPSTPPPPVMGGSK